jgi:hypothetical protein
VRISLKAQIGAMAFLTVLPLASGAVLAETTVPYVTLAGA